MNNPKPNISLSNLSEINSTGVILALRKGINELFRRNKQLPSIKPKLSASFYPNIISVIICTANKNNFVIKSIQSILNQNFDTDRYEIIVVNNSTKPFISEKLPKCVKIINETTLGLSKARNTGASAAKGEYLLYIDDDALANDGLLSSIYSAFEKHKRTAIVGGQIFLNLPVPVPEIFLEGREALWSAYTVPYKNFKEIREQYEFPFGACFGIRHSILDSLGGFPQSYGRTGDDFAGGEETAICFSVLNAGLKIGICPTASVTHFVSPDRFSREHVRRTIREGIITTYRLYKDGYSKNGWTHKYIDERLNIIKKELRKTSGLATFYKQCEYDAFLELKEIM